jgi:acetylornithine deacetylase/succinyl-diaminopimelate desuccinylase-like protein
MGGVDRRVAGRGELMRVFVNVNTHIAATMLLAAAAGPAAAQRVSATTFHQLGHAILREMVETNTTGSSGDVTNLAGQLATRFHLMGFPDSDVAIVGPTPKNRNLVLRYRGTGAHRPVLLLAHLDVVEAKRSDWTYDPFLLTENNGYFYGRGTQDQKGGATLLTTTLLRLKQEGWIPDRDLILALTAGEEGGMGYDGVEWLIKNRHDLIDADYAINVDGGGGEIENGKHALFDVQAAEKVYHSVSLTAKNPGGHSSLPRKDNAIYTLARALDRVAAYSFPAKPNDIVKAYFRTAATTTMPAAVAADMRKVAAGSLDPAVIKRLSAYPYYNAILRTTCVATMLEGGHAENALPQTAKATVNCRILPGEDPVAVERTLTRVIGDTAVVLAPIDTAKPSPPSPLRSDLFDMIAASVKATWGPMPIVPTLSTGATDGLYLLNAGMPVYGFTGMFIATDDDREHGKDERILISSFDDGLDFTYDLLKRLAGAAR